MKIAALVTLQVCAVFMCHTTADTGSRSKRTLKFFENLMNSMREAFGPEPPDLPPPEVIAKVASLPYSNPYTYFPTIRMHVRPIKPVEKHVVYVKTLSPPASAPLVIRPNLNDVDIIRMIQPLVRRPKSNSATIHYEIIPITIPVHAPVNHSPFSGDPEFESEDTAFSNVPWTMGALPPPVPTSKPFDSDEDHRVPWQLQALPPPVATKSPYWQPILKSTASNDDEMFFPVKKKIMIPATGRGQPRANVYNHHKFVASPLESEVSIQPSMELTAFTETDSITVPPISNFRGRRIFNKKDTHNSKYRPKRDTRANFPKYAELSSTKFKNGSTLKPASSNQSIPSTSSVTLISPLIFKAKKITKVLRPPEDESFAVEEDPVKYKNLGLKSSESKRVYSTTRKTANKMPDTENADREDTLSAHSERRKNRMNFTDDTVSIVKSHDILSDHPTHHEYIPIIRGLNSSREFLGFDKNDKLTPKRLSPVFSTSSENAKKRFNPQGTRTSFNKQSEASKRRRPSIYSNSGRFAPLSNENPKYSQSDEYSSKSGQSDAFDDLFGERPHQKDSDGRYFEKSARLNFNNPLEYDRGFDKPSKSNFDEPSRNDFDKASGPEKHDFGKSVNFNFAKPPRFNDDKPSRQYNSENSSPYDFDKRTNSDFYKDEQEEDRRPHSDYENIEYFEPIIIDIDSEEKSFGNFVSKFRPKSKVKSSPVIENNRSNEPLKLPDSLHETVDVIKMKSAHPPTFDLMSEANEHATIAMIKENEIR